MSRPARIVFFVDSEALAKTEGRLTLQEVLPRNYALAKQHAAEGNPDRVEREQQRGRTVFRLFWDARDTITPEQREAATPMTERVTP